MAAVVLALCSAVAFGSLAVTLTKALGRYPDAELGAFATVLAALIPVGIGALVRFEWSGHVWPYLLAGLLAPGASQILYVAAVRDAGPSRTALVVGAAPLVSVTIALDGTRGAGAARPLIVGARPDRARRRRADARAGAAGHVPVDRARCSRSARPRSSRRATTSSAASRRTSTSRPSSPPRRRSSRAASMVAALPHGAARPVRARCAVSGRRSWPSRPRGSSGASRTCFSSRRSPAAASRSSARSSLSSRSSASSWRRSFLGRTELVGRHLWLGAALIVTGGALIGAFR